MDEDCFMEKVGRSGKNLWKKCEKVEKRAFFGVGKKTVEVPVFPKTPLFCAM